MDIRVEKLPESELTARGVRDWPIWEKEVSRFDWTYDSVEECFLLEGDVTVEAGGESVRFGAGDYVTFPRGLSCVWDIRVPVKKHYRFS